MPTGSTMRNLATSSDRRMVKARLLAFLLLSILAMAALAYWALRPRIYTIALPQDAERYEHRFDAWAKYLETRSAPFRATIARVPDAATALRAISDGKADLAVVRVDDDVPGEIRSFAILGRRAILIAPSAQNTTDEDIAYLADKFSKIAGARQNLVLTENTATPVEAGLKALPEIERVKELFPFLISASIEQKSRTGANANIDTLALTTQLVGSDSLSKSEGAELGRWIQNGRRALSAGDPGSVIFPNHEQDESLRAHDGIAAFKTREETSFIQRNSDLIYIGMATLGAVASLLGAIFANIRSKLRDGGLRFMTRLETLTRELRGAETPDRIYRIADTGLELAQSFARELAAHKVESRIDSSFQTLYQAFRSEVTVKLERSARDHKSTAGTR
jgi:hypothetical protein